MNYIGSLPDGKSVYVSDETLAIYGLDSCKAELVDTYWHRVGLLPPDYYKVKTSLSGDYEIIKANSQQDAIDKYMKSK